MKNFKKIILIITLPLLLTNCGKQQTEKPKGLLKYTLLKDDISDTPIKTQILTDILIEEKDSVTEKKLEELLNYLFNERIQKTGFQFHKNPNTVAIYAYTTQEKAKAGVGQWIAMISKMYNDENPKFDISETQMNSLNSIDQIKWDLTQKQREEIWEKIIFAERNSQIQADIKIPMNVAGITLDDIKKNVTLMRKIKDKLEKNIITEYEINRQVLDSIGIEGLVNGWAFPEH